MDRTPKMVMLSTIRVAVRLWTLECFIQRLHLSFATTKI